MKSLVNVRITLLIPALILIGCQGQHGFKRETNPVKDYSNAIGDSRPWRKGLGTEPKPDPTINDQKVCPPPFQLAIPEAQGNRVLTFHEGSESSYLINILPQTSYPFSVNFELPTGATAREVKAGSNQWQITWRPAVGKTRITTAVLKLSSPELQARCGVGAPFSESVNLLVNPDDGAPVLTVTPPPAEPLTFGGSYQFKIRITDPAATADQPPEWTAITATARGNAEATIRTIGAKEAVDCSHQATPISDRTYEFDCKFTSSLLKNPPLDSGETVNAVFFVTGVSKRTGRKTADADGFPTAVKVTFPKKPDPAPIRPDPEHGITVANKAGAPAATPAAADSRGVQLTEEAKRVPLPPRRPIEFGGTKGETK